MFFKLNIDKKLIKGKKKDLVYSLMDGTCFYFEKKYKEMLELLETGMDEKDLENKYEKTDIKKFKKYVHENKIGQFYEVNSIYSPTMRKDYINIKSESRNRKFRLNSVMIRINNSCNLNCKFCIDKKQISAPCLCFQDDEKIELTCKEVDNIVEQIIKMDACQVKIIGGEPFWDKQKLFGIIDIINKAHLESVIYTNGLLISEEDAQKLSKYNTKIILNILSNAIKYTPDNGTIKVYVGFVYNDAYIKVIDNGIGIPEEDLERIFDRFYRVDKARSRKLGGTGLGLSIAKEIMEKNGGSINIKSKVNEGTEVTIKIPVKK